MNALPFVIAGVIAFFCGAWASGWLARRRPDWSPRKRHWMAALPLPLIILLAAVAGAAWTVISGPGRGENMQGLALVVIGSMGAMFAVLTFAAAFLGAARRDREIMR